MMTRRIGFTLVELLVVIAIVGVLVALLIPAVQSVRESARRMKCNSNLHQLGIGIQQYAQASGGHFPWTYHAATTNSWIVTVAPFLENVDEIRLCPDDPLGEAARDRYHGRHRKRLELRDQRVRGLSDAELRVVL